MSAPHKLMEAMEAHGATAMVVLTLGGAYSIAGNSESLYLPLQQKTVTYYYDNKYHPIQPTEPSKYEAPKKVVTVTGATKGKPLSISNGSSKLGAIAGVPL